MLRLLFVVLVAFSASVSAYPDFPSGGGVEVNDLATDGAENIADTEIFIGDGAGTGDYFSLSSDVTMTNAGVVTIGANAVTLTTDTTGNYMSGASGGDGIAVTHTPAEGSTATIAADIVTAGSDADSSTTSADGGLEFVNNELTLLRGCAEGNDLKWDEANDHWECSSGDSLEYANLYLKDEDGTPTTFTISAQDTWEDIDSFDSDGPEATLDGSNATDDITVSHPGDYLITLSASFGGGSSDEYEFRIVRDTDSSSSDCTTGITELSQCYFSRKLGTGGDVGNAGISCIATLSADDLIYPCALNQDASDDITFHEISFSAARVDVAGSADSWDGALTDLDIDGGTDIGAALVDADLLVVDDGANGTNRKMEASRLKTYLEKKSIWRITNDVSPITASTDDLACFYLSDAFTLTGVYGSLNGVGSTSGTTTIDINEGGTTVLSTKLTIDYGESTSETAAAAYVISDSALAANSQMCVEIDAVTGGGDETGLVVTLEGYY